jgi:hypothetical protein
MKTISMIIKWLSSDYFFLNIFFSLLFLIIFFAIYANLGNTK